MRALTALASRAVMRRTGPINATWAYWVQAFYYFPVDRIIQNTFFNNPEWVALRGRDRDNDMSDPSTYLGSCGAKRINSMPQYAGKLFQKTSGLLEIGYDHLQCFNFVNYSIGMVNIRQAYPEDAGKSLTGSHCSPLADIMHAISAVPHHHAHMQLCRSGAARCRCTCARTLTLGRMLQVGRHPS